ncbi:MAG: potassium-transporting ATPase subunit C, partial [Thermoplasmata archaeon]
PHPPAPPALPGPPPPDRRIYSNGRHLRAALALLVVAILALGGLFPLALVGFGEIVDPSAANGSLTYFPNGTVNGSHLLPSNTTSTFGLLGAPSGPAAAPPDRGAGVSPGPDWAFVRPSPGSHGNLPGAAGRSTPEVG